jgi:hypothetical protein
MARLLLNKAARLLRKPKKILKIKYPFPQKNYGDAPYEN